MLNTKHIGYFILHTIKPMIEELDQLLDKTKNLHNIDVHWLMEELVNLELTKCYLYCITYICISCIIGWVTWIILH